MNEAMGLTVAQFNDHFFHRTPLGLARYGRELFQQLRKEKDLEILPLGTWSNMARPELRAWCTRTGGRVLPGGRKAWALAWHLLGHPHLERIVGPFDLLHFTAPGYVVPTRRPVIATIHDIGLITNRQDFSRSYPSLFKGHMRDLVRRRSEIICVSKHTADEFRQHVSADLNIEVIYEAPAEGFSRTPDDRELQDYARKQQLERPFFLSVGSVNPRKNLKRLVRAFSGLLERVPHDLVLVGARGWDDDDFWRVVRTPELEKRVRFLGFVRDRELNLLYRLAEAFVFVSTFEGFGLPAVEAMCAGCAVIASSTTSLGEIVGSAGLLVEPTATDSIHAALLRVAEDRSLQQDLMERGKSRSEMFSWQRTATQTLELYRRIAAVGG